MTKPSLVLCLGVATVAMVIGVVPTLVAATDPFRSEPLRQCVSDYPARRKAAEAFNRRMDECAVEMASRPPGSWTMIKPQLAISEMNRQTADTFDHESSRCTQAGLDLVRKRQTIYRFALRRPVLDMVRSDAAVIQSTFQSSMACSQASTDWMAR